MRLAGIAVVLMAWVQLSARPAPAFDLHGNLELIDPPRAATPVEAIMVSLHPTQEGVFDIQAEPDRHGDFVLKRVMPGRYSLALPIPGKILSFSVGSRKLAPDGFELDSSTAGPVRIVVSLKTSSSIVTARRLPSKSGGIIALLASADRHLTLRFSCHSHTLTGPETEFRYVPPGRYRVFIVDSQLQSKIAAYAPRFPDFLKNQATEVEVLNEGGAIATATYVDSKAVRQAIQQAGRIP